MGRGHRRGRRDVRRLELGCGGNGNYVNVNANRAVNIDRNFNRNNVGHGGRWQHQVDHRKGVAYRDNATRQQFNQNRPGRRPAPAVPRPGGAQAARPGAGPGAGRRRPGQRPGGAAGAGGDRPGGGAGAAAASGRRPGRAERATARAVRWRRRRRLGGVDRGQQVNREVPARQRPAAEGSRSSSGGGGGARAGGGGGGGGGGEAAVAVAAAAEAAVAVAVAVEDVDEQADRRAFLALALCAGLCGGRAGAAQAPASIARLPHRRKRRPMR